MELTLYDMHKDIYGRTIIHTFRVEVISLRGNPLLYIGEWTRHPKLEATFCVDS